MLVPSAEQSFQQGLEAYAQGRHMEAMALFEAAIDIEHRLGHDASQPRYLSYYGLCLGLTNRKVYRAIELCRAAVSSEPYNADLHYNLATVLLTAGRRKKAHESLVQGLGLHPDHAGIRKHLSGMGVRRRPVLPFLSRGNPVNVALGRFRNP